MRYLSMAALALVGAMMTGCSSDDFESQPANNVITVTTTVDLDDNDATRSLSWEGTPTKSMNKTFAVGETMAILYKNTSGNFVKAVSNALTDGNITSGGKSATFTFDLENPDKTYPVEYVYPASMLTDGGSINEDALSNEQDGTLATLASKFDYCSAMNNWVGDNLPSLTLTNRLAILAITLKDNAATPNDITSTITGMTLSDGTYNYSVTRSAAAEGPIFVAIRPTTTADISYTATDGTHFFVKEVTNKTYKSNHVYPLGLRMATSNTINLARLSANFTAQNGQTLTGTLGANVKISIAANASVTLDNATINGVNSWDYEWAGITCLGDATIILEGTNTVKGFQNSYPGIQAAYNDTGVGDEYTLTIQGTGSLTASSNGRAAGIGASNYGECGNITISGGTITATGGDDAAGIGSGEGRTCGNITISNGTVTATGGSNAAGIGTGGTGASCGNITISGGIVTATGGSKGAGIGTGKGMSCGNITITTGVTVVTATKGSSATNSIGVGYQGTCGTVTVGGTVYWNGSAYQNDGATYLTTSPLVYPTPAPTGAIDGLFSVSSTKKVYFSQGNLQAYNATANSTSGWVWSFAEHQWDYIGSSGSNQYINGSMTVSQAGYVDLFNWVGTSASYDNYGIVYDNDQSGWGHEGINFGNKTNDALKHDWGHNPITNGGNVADMWRTPTNDEWVYLINSRTTAAGTAPTINGTADARYAKAKLFGTNRGLIIFPDTYVHPDGVAYPTGINAASNTSWNGNQYSAADWAKMEAAGCVFLPCAGMRVYYTTVNDKETRGFYASSTPHLTATNQAKVMHFTESSCDPSSNRFRRDAGPVRLVKDAD